MAAVVEIVSPRFQESNDENVPEMCMSPQRSRIRSLLHRKVEDVEAPANNWKHEHKAELYGGNMTPKYMIHDGNIQNAQL